MNRLAAHTTNGGARCSLSSLKKKVLRMAEETGFFRPDERNDAYVFLLDVSDATIA